MNSRDQEISREMINILKAGLWGFGRIDGNESSILSSQVFSPYFGHLINETYWLRPLGFIDQMLLKQCIKAGFRHYSDFMFLQLLDCAEFNEAQEDKLYNGCIWIKKELE